MLVTNLIRNLCKPCLVVMTCQTLLAGMKGHKTIHPGYLVFHIAFSCKIDHFSWDSSLQMNASLPNHWRKKHEYTPLTPCQPHRHLTTQGSALKGLNSCHFRVDCKIAWVIVVPFHNLWSVLHMNKVTRWYTDGKVPLSMAVHTSILFCCSVVLIENLTALLQFL